MDDNIFVINPTSNMTKYILPLDCIDLNLMPMKIYESRNTLLKGHEDEFHMFEIYTEYTGNAIDGKSFLYSNDRSLLYFGIFLEPSHQPYQ